MPDKLSVEVDGKVLTLSNLDKVMYPKTGFTKGDLISYYQSVAPVLLPHLRGRPLTLKRYPNGVDGGYFYEKKCPDHRPDWVETVPIWTETRGHEVRYCVANDLATLVWAANLADLELHTSLSIADEMEHPTAMVFDLDPGPPADVTDCVKVALRLRDVHEELGLRSFAKTSGSKGLQVFIPLNTKIGYEAARPFSNAIATMMETSFPKEVTSNMKKSLRRGKVLIDWSQNNRHKTTVCVYSLRALENPTVSTPLDWGEVEAAAEKDDPSLLVFDHSEVLSRVDKHGDLFSPVLDLKQHLPALKTIES